MEERAGGSGSIFAGVTGVAGVPGAFFRSGEDVIRFALLVVRDVKTLRLEIEHRAIASAKSDQLVVGAKLDDSAPLKYADTIGVAHCRKTMRDQDGRAMPCRGEQAIEDFRLPAHVELRGRLVEQHDAGAKLDGREGTRERDTLPLATREVGTVVVAACEHGV